MMNTKFLLFFVIFFSIYGLGNYYVGLRGWQAVRSGLPLIGSHWYWLLFFIVAISYPLGRFGEKFLPHSISDVLTIFGSYWLAASYYLLIIVLLIDLLRVIDRWTGLLPSFLKESPGSVGLAVVVVTLGILLYGTVNARSPVIRNYTIEIPKKAGSLETLHVVMVSDIHLGKIVDTPRLVQLVDTIKELNPDIVLLPGDMIDEDVDLFVEKKMSDVFRKLTPKFGTYAVLGNHEYIGRKTDLAIYHLEQGGIRVLLDQYKEIDNSFYVVGRDDRSRQRFAQAARKDLSAIMTGIDPTLPIILMDHQPFDLHEAQSQGVDLQLSGHTHRGQFFPNNLITQALYEVDWGYLRKDNLHVIVSCGFGTWGPPIRVGNTPEIVTIDIRFREASP
jgi:uncharacterized protein